MKEYPETHQRGTISLENEEIVLKLLHNSTQGDFGIQIARDGRVWVCIDGIAFIRFKPEGMGFGEVHSRTILKDVDVIPPMHPRTEKVAV